MEFDKSLPKWFLNECTGIEFLISRAEAKVNRSPALDRSLASYRELLSVAERLAESKGMRAVWSSLDRVVAGRKLPASGPSLIHSVYLAMYQFKDFERMTPNDRRDYVTKVQKLSRELAGLLKPARELSRITWTQVRAKEGGSQVPVGWPAPNFGCDWLPSSLEAMADACDIWLKGFDPVVPRPNSVNAERLFVMRKLTHNFRRELGQPMRRAVFEVVGTFYDVSDLTPNDVTKLAP